MILVCVAINFAFVHFVLAGVKKRSYLFFFSFCTTVIILYARAACLSGIWIWNCCFSFFYGKVLQEVGESFIFCRILHFSCAKQKTYLIKILLRFYCMYRSSDLAMKPRKTVLYVTERGENTLRYGSFVLQRFVARLSDQLQLIYEFWVLDLCERVTAKSFNFIRHWRI